MEIICPLDWRYGGEEIRYIFSRQGITSYRIKVEIALLKSLMKQGYLSENDVKTVENASKEVTLEEIDSLEKKLGHDVMAMVVAIAEKSGESGRFVHFGATSYDIVDTAYALMFRDALNIIKRKLIKNLDRLSTLANEYRDIIMVGRTHGQHALPITFGFKLANYIYELSRSLERIIDTEKRVVKGKMSGAVGTMAAWGEKGLEIEKEVMRILEIQPHEISTQIAPRDGFAELISDLAILASQMDRLSTEIRELMRPEILEVAEGVGNRVGSSTMPQKENPVTAEKISGLAKVMRGFVISEMENIPLWHERDLTNSASERIILSHAFVIMDEMLDSLFSLLNGIIVYPENMEKNLNLTKGAIMAESLMINLTLRGLPRHKAHELVMELSRKAEREGKSLQEVALESEQMLRYISKDDIKIITDPKRYLGSYSQLIDRSLQYFRDIIKENSLKQ
ncbi:MULTISPECIES: adenylosuccinate lyase [Acidianus]|uniref:Adenylosuccinate lyase n=1 Tax=Candidatus Acidianus copahuensis TaxID=1160895 RepID=A0A031LLJ2_9CREN|nr:MULTISPECIES: adenylosuccinate lyase [Acidianus]EZQ03072.1 adenylosuccinate lyase [Candidatus Acidianus copahuensis]NON62921.1 adenylosuccinate lyase [Acidianus sp. RZ1]